MEIYTKALSDIKNLIEHLDLQHDFHPFVTYECNFTIDIDYLAESLNKYVIDNGILRALSLLLKTPCDNVDLIQIVSVIEVKCPELQTNLWLNDNNLPLNAPFKIFYGEICNRCLLGIKVNHLIADASDARKIITDILAIIKKRFKSPTITYDRFSQNVKKYESYYASETTIREVDNTLSKNLLKLNTPYKSIPFPHTCNSILINLNKRPKFNFLVAAIAKTLQCVLGMTNMVIQYPYIQNYFKQQTGFFTEVKLMLLENIDVFSLNDLCHQIALARSVNFEHLQISIADLTQVKQVISSKRLPRIVISDTDRFSNVDVLCAPTKYSKKSIFDDVRFLMDRSSDPNTLLIEYKIHFISDEIIASIVKNLFKNLEQFDILSTW